MTCLSTASLYLRYSLEHYAVWCLPESAEIIILNCFVQFLKTLTQCGHCAVLFYLTQKLIEMLNTFAPFNGHYKRANKSVFSNLK